MAMGDSSTKAFVAGIASALAVVQVARVYQQWNKHERGQQNRGIAGDKKPQSQKEPVSSSAPGPDLMDSPDLELRMIRKAESAIRNRTTRLSVVIERCTNDHNYSAILRTVEALGIQNIYIIAPPQRSTLELHPDEPPKANESNNQEESIHAVGDGDSELQEEGGDDGEDTTAVHSSTKLMRSTGQVVKRATINEIEDRAMHHLFAQKAMEWITVKEFEDTASCIKELKATGHDIWATDLGQVATCLTYNDLLADKLMETGMIRVGGSDGDDERETVIPPKLAIVFGTEAVGCTSEMLNAADKRVYLPLRGFADSLNLSVATALVVHQLFVLDPTLVGAISEEECVELRKVWYVKLARQRLLTSSQKKRRNRLLNQVRSCEQWKTRQERGEYLEPKQIKKLEKLPEHKQQVQELDEELDRGAFEAVKHLFHNPPDPITDMRRADEHRICYVGRNTKKMYTEEWKDMPATSNVESLTSTPSNYFREKSATKIDF